MCNLWTGCLVCLNLRWFEHLVPGCDAILRRWGLTGLWGVTQREASATHSCLCGLSPAPATSPALMDWNHPETMRQKKIHSPLSCFCQVFYHGSKKNNEAVPSLSYLLSVSRTVLGLTKVTKGHLGTLTRSSLLNCSLLLCKTQACYWSTRSWSYNAKKKGGGGGKGEARRKR